MNAKHQFKYTYNEGCEEFSPVEVTFDMPGDVTITQMLWNFECYLKSCGFVFDGHLEVVPESGYDVIDDTNYCCMGDNDNKTDCYGKDYTPSPEVKKNNWVQGICNPPSPDWKASNSDNCWNS
jgi:hypothetical protein